MGDRNPNRPASVKVLIAALCFLGASATSGGVVLMLDPSGSLIGLPRESLLHTPFDDYLIPGLFLFLVLGFMALVVARALWLGLHWSSLGALFVGVALAAWITVQVMTIGLYLRPPLQPLFAVLALIMIGLTRLKQVARYVGSSDLQGASVDRRG